eukprot:6006623-Alexandrium_andersonii.AAC.1
MFWPGCSFERSLFQGFDATTALIKHATKTGSGAGAQLDEAAAQASPQTALSGACKPPKV